MGYYTDFDISNNSEEVIQEIEVVSNYKFYDGVMNGKWYDHNKHCLEVSKKFPNELIVVEGEGEESGDLWKEYYMAGKSQRAKAAITFEPFDESKLQ